MKAFLVCTLSLLILSSAAPWETNFDKAKQLAAQGHKYIMLTFSGSDWCGPCIRLHKEIFESGPFESFADTTLILVNADFPRDKKNQLSKEQQNENDKLADKYNANGSFPYTILLTADGNVLKVWDGYPKMSPGDFVSDVQSAINSKR